MGYYNLLPITDLQTSLTLGYIKNSGSSLLGESCRLDNPTGLPLLTVLFCYNYMYRTLADPKFLRRLSYRCLRLNNVRSNFHCPLFDIILQRELPQKRHFYNVCPDNGQYAPCTLNTLIRPLMDYELFTVLSSSYIF